MKIKRYFAPDMRQAIRLVRENQGPDAVILSSRSVEGGIELIAAMDYDEEAVLEMATQAGEPVSRASTSTAGRPISPDVRLRSRAPDTGMESAADPGMPEPEAAVSLKADAGVRVSSGEFPSLRARRDDVWAEEGLHALMTPVVEPPPTSPPASEPAPSKPARAKKVANIEWSQEPTLLAMQKEIQGLRAMLQDQLASLAGQEFMRRDPGRAGVVARLQRMGLEPELAKEIAMAISHPDDPAEAWQEALTHLSGRLAVTPDGILDQAGIMTLVGPSGVGKTTTVAKLAALQSLRHGHDSVALITTDAYRIGAHRQLQTFGQILEVPVYLAQTARQLGDMLEGLKSKRLVIIDTAGTNQRDMKLLGELESLTSVPSARTLLVMAANVQKAVMMETVKSFARLQPEGCVLTKVDEAASLGEALSTLISAGLPLTFVSEGQRIPDDLRPARGARLVATAARMADAGGERGDTRQAQVVSPMFREPINQPNARYVHASSQ
ncbi:flagellar biosynthesis protein FlhF [Ectothiorhodospira lacustris]|uniref:flagellar biosynthesis protein FlhF n=1 Tax=Ectothiorhodospira lacustris TaxID=2899127 RepID=UPI001EE79F34|nr:flagellar biosynthesis protein FlhF [Ectothiorhodospira lacustris]MCG5499515.1 flagellar biosynthesis protein FlhF [Ectothiorhodospira lacustris]MCG5511093.1 flagellar biosynthesis protein FlhF [Ectothiorhodospira lacustris]MCG5522899.1 flagellar biosynthesis protein FlhF [Ectothiorhodospira lacustris]